MHICSGFYKFKPWLVCPSYLRPPDGKGPSSQHFRTLSPETIPSMVPESLNIEYLHPHGVVSLSFLEHAPDIEGPEILALSSACQPGAGG